MRRLIMFLLQVTVGAVFIYAALDKGLHPPDPGMPWATDTMYGNIIAGRLWLHYLFVACEFLLGAWLVSNILTREAALAVILTLCVFAGLIGSELSKEHPKPCGCMSEELYLGREGAIRKGLWGSLERDGLLLAGSLAIFFMAGRMPKKPKPEEHQTPEAEPAQREQEQEARA